MAARTRQGAALDRKKLFGDPIMVTTIVVLIAFLTLFILYPLAILLVDSFVGDGGFSFSVFKRIFAMPNFRKAITNTLKVGFVVGLLSAFIGLLFDGVLPKAFPKDPKAPEGMPDDCLAKAFFVNGDTVILGYSAPNAFYTPEIRT